MNPRFWLGFIFCSIGALGALFAFSLLPGTPSVSAQPPGQNHKVSVSDRQLVASLTAQGARIVADYGSYVLLTVNDRVAASLQNNRAAQIVDDYNKVLLNSGAIDTQTAAAQALHGTAMPGAGKDMRLIQFAGPVRPEWYQALQDTGARIVTYIPNNAYLVYGTSQTLRAVQQLATNPSIAQWEGAYEAAARLDPAVTAQTAPAREFLSGKGNEQFAIQLVEDADENAVTLALIDQLKLEPVMSQDSMLGYVNVRVALPRDAVIQQLAQRSDVVSIQRFSTPVPRDERQDVILSGNLNGNVPMMMDYFTYLTGHGINIDTIATFGVNLSDTGVDNGTQVPNHFGLYKSGDPTNPANSRIIYNRRIPSGGGTIQGCDGHGNINAHIIGGYVPTGTINGVNFDAFPHADASLFHWGRGLAPFVTVGSSVIFDPNFTFPTLRTSSQRLIGIRRESAATAGVRRGLTLMTLKPSNTTRSFAMHNRTATAFRRAASRRREIRNTPLSLRPVTRALALIRLNRLQRQKTSLQLAPLRTSTHLEGLIFAAFPTAERTAPMTSSASQAGVRRRTTASSRTSWDRART